MKKDNVIDLDLYKKRAQNRKNALLDLEIINRAKHLLHDLEHFRDDEN